jgi:tRNA(Arg) A34 adenosine deaminase TadA
MLCAEKILQAKIGEVVFVDGYPDLHGLLLFNEVGLSYRMFEGVRSRNFHRYFADVQQAKEQEAVDALRNATLSP